MLLGFVVIIWIIIFALLLLFSTKYDLIKAKCINPDECISIKEKDGFIIFEYEKDYYGRGKNSYNGKATSVSWVKVGKECKILVTKDFNERVIVFADVLKLIIAMTMLSLLLVFYI